MRRADTRATAATRMTGIRATALLNESGNLSSRSHRSNQGDRDAIAHFLPVYSLRPGNVTNIFAGGPHSFAICDGPAEYGKPLIKIDKLELVYTDSAVLHRFLRLSLPKDGDLYQRMWAKLNELPGLVSI